MAAIGAPRISRYLGRKRFQRFSPRASRNIATETATMLRSSPSAALTRARAESTLVIPMATSRTPTPAGAGGRRRGRRCVRGRCPWLPSGLVGNVTLDRECSNRYIATMRWLMLLATLPPTPTRHRVGVWRKLQRMGAVRLRGSAWLLPETAETTELSQWLVQEIETIRGEATLVHVERIENMADEQVRALFHKARTVEYQDVVRGSREVLAQLDRAKSAHRASFAQVRAKLEGLKRELDRIESIDHLESPAGRRAHELWARTARRLTAAEARPVAGSGTRRASTLPAPGSTWVTRPRPHIDRIASAWLIKWFFDAQAKFAFADAADAPKKGVPFDILGAEFGHHGEDCGAEAKDVTVPSHRAPGGRTMRKTTTALAFLVAWF